MATVQQNYICEHRLCHASVTAVTYPLSNGFGQEKKKNRKRVKTEDQMNGNYYTAKFLANERVNDQLANAKYHRLAKRNNKGLGNKSILNNIWPALVESKQWMTGITSYLVNA